MSDRLFVYDIEKAGKLHSAAIESPVYSYFFNYRGAHSKSEYRADTKKNLGTDHLLLHTFTLNALARTLKKNWYFSGVSHGDDTSYVLRTIMDTLSTDDDRQMTEIMLDMVTSFMKTG